MDFSFPILMALTLGSAVAAMSLRNLIHCALWLIVTFVGLAGLYLQLGAEFVGFAQVLVYVGAVAILIVFAILLTRREGGARAPLVSGGWLLGIGVALLVTGALVFSLGNSTLLRQAAPPKPAAGARLIGERMMTDYVLPLEVVGMLLTAALVGAVLIALREQEEKP